MKLFSSLSSAPHIKRHHRHLKKCLRRAHLNGRSFLPARKDTGKSSACEQFASKVTLQLFGVSSSRPPPPVSPHISSPPSPLSSLSYFVHFNIQTLAIGDHKIFPLSSTIQCRIVICRRLLKLGRASCANRPMSGALALYFLLPRMQLCLPFLGSLVP